MALKGPRHELQTDQSTICNDVVEQGQILSYQDNGPYGSGINLDSPNNLSELFGTLSSGTEYVPYGLSLTNIVNIDTTRQHVNYHKDEVTTGGHPTVLKQGWVVTDKVVASCVPLTGQKAYMAHSGLLSNNSNNGVHPLVGRFEGSKDPDGFVKVTIHLP